MPDCFFVTDLHGILSRYQKLFKLIIYERPAAVFIGGDILPRGSLSDQAIDISHHNFINKYLLPEFLSVQYSLQQDYPTVFIIMGNDDACIEESAVLSAGTSGIWHYIHNRHFSFGEFSVFGYSYVPPTPFLLKDWERYDISRYVDPGCVSPEEGYRSVPVSKNEKKYSTIEKDLEMLARDLNLNKSIFLFHTPPYQTKLDRAALDGQTIDHCPLDVHVGSIALKRFIEIRQPGITLHGHIHESARLTGSWREQIGKTHCFSAAHDGPELAVVRFDPHFPENAARELH